MTRPDRHDGRSAARRGFLRDTHGAAAAEMVLWISALTLPILSAVDIGNYVYRRIQVETAAEAGVQAVHRACYPFLTPLTKTGNCDTLTSAVTTAVQSTQLGTAVTVASGYPSEGYYCVNSSNALVLVGTAGTVGSPPTKPSPFTCASVVAGSTGFPGTYVRVSATYAYAPIFPGLSIAALLPTPIARTAWTRVN